MHGLESGSGLQVEQQAGSSSEGSHGRRERDRHDPPSFKLSVMCMAWNTLLVNMASPVLSAPPHKYDPF